MVTIIYLLTNLLINAEQDWWNETKVLQLDSSTFYDYVGKDQYCIVEVYDPY